MGKLGDPVCGNCGYELAGAVTASVCPECGRPLVEVLERRPTGNSANYRRYRSERTLFGHPLIDIAYGPDPGERAGKARGIIALGDDAIGLIAVGGLARGGIAIGGLAFGGIAIGGIAVGGLGAQGGLAVAGLAALGGFALSGYFAIGGLAAGHVGTGGFFVPLW